MYIQKENIIWDDRKNEILKETRGVSFEYIQKLIQSQEYVTLIQNPTNHNQELILFLFDNYIWVCPILITDDETVLNTVFPSQKYNKIYNDQ